MPDISTKKWSTTTALCLFLGALGIHSFYLQKIGKGIAQLLTFGGLGIWALIDLLTLIFGVTKDAEGNTLEKPAGVPKMASFIFGGFVVLVIIISMSLEENKDSQSSNNAIDSKISKENCYKIKIGMRYNQVKAILGEPAQTTESEMTGIGKTELWHFQDTGISSFASGKIEACTIYFSNGKVSSKSWTKI